MGIVIVDYGMGNLRSVYNALISLGADVKITAQPSLVKKAAKLILPGVGAFQDAMKGLVDRDLIEPIKEFIISGRIYLGICLGLQLLFEESEEGNAKGLGILKGKVIRFKEKKGVKIPHMGWNSIKVKSQKSKVKSTSQKSKVKILDGIPDNSYFYFVHSYYAEPKDKNIIYGRTEYARVNFASMILKDNIFAAQFHPERSQALGLRFLRNFIGL